jgi:hypothetical protein
MINSVFSKFTAFGFSGSRSAVSVGCSVAAAAVPAGASVFVGCARGVDNFFRDSFPNAVVLSASNFGTSPSCFARRSVAVVQRVLAAGGLWVAFPSSPCPAGLLPSSSSSRCFSGTGSGSWASLAFALGSGVPCLVFLGSLPCPAGWGLFPVPECPGWVGCAVVCCLPVPVQLSLF